MKHLPFLALFVCLAEFSAVEEWCYTGCPHSPSHWSDIPESFCGGQRQSPIDINNSHAEIDSSLLNFTFTNFSNQYVFKSLENNGHTVKCALETGQVEVSGGGLNGSYTALQFHLHWGDTKLHPGSEHAVDGHRYPMEMHIVTVKKGLTVEEAVKDSEGIAALAFFITETEDDVPMQPWQDLTSYLDNVTSTGSKVNITHNISISDLVGYVDHTKFYRYKGSLTTPLCYEAVVWTIFQEPIKVHKELIELFPNKTMISNVYRPLQAAHGRHVYKSPASGHDWCYDDHCEYSPDKWHLLPESHCRDHRQSPVNFVDKDTEEDDKLDEFSFTRFDDKQAMDYIINTGHTVKCVLKEGVEVTGGGLGHIYSTLQFHFHWGDDSEHPKGSEHTVDSVRRPMEMHIVNKRKDLTLEEAKETPNGLAVLGFFIEAADEKKSGGPNKSGESSHGEIAHGESSHGESVHGENAHGESTSDTNSSHDYWTKFTSYLSAVANTNSKASVHEAISIDDLLGEVDRSAYYRYNGSLTTPSCNPAVVWTVFKEPIKVDKKLMMHFPREVGYHKVYRPPQPLGQRKVYTTRSSSSCTVPGLTAALLLLACLGPFITAVTD